MNAAPENKATPHMNKKQKICAVIFVGFYGIIMSLYGTNIDQSSKLFQMNGYIFWISMISIIILFSFVEEIIFRKLLWRLCSWISNDRFAAAITTVIWCAIHYFDDHWRPAILLPVGIVLAYCKFKNKNIRFSSFMHFWYNFLIFSILMMRYINLNYIQLCNESCFNHSNFL